ncbi:SGNH/GDSL hydrolase family protein [Klebsiella variicola]|uniref:SGNH/GDSL hydrolase family protein n=1 Tax=Klebsiella variicola TaxID=244366 RepID=UPI0011E67463|nr:SGNH/GDSL hydrolase family protein [Klebsiella variicola]MBK2547019.1 SGNH/GDSL hydrolase family protein [Klebsiella variicola]MCI4413838.1 SGNH/GDSL hydrolase family protein [Klebsiella variicola]TYL68135.1 SGNH/GDSL hydrolase family protein [Klebsiella variicola]WNN08529.1 SGNH/GDSL hydrolase family protein [Klebsiella variicola]
MTTISETADWVDAIYQITRMDKVEGGAKGVANIQAKQLAARTQFLKIMIEGFSDYKESTFFKTAEDPDGTIAGIAATPSGKLFRVAQGLLSDDAFIFYLNVDGVAIPVAVYAGKSYVDRRLVPGHYRSSFVPVLHDKNDTVPLWLDKGVLDAPGLGPLLQSFVAKIPNEWAQKYLTQKNLSPRFFPIIHDENDMVPLWLDKGLLDAAGLGPVLQGFIKKLVGNSQGGTASADKYFIQGDLYKFIFKRGRVFSGDAVSLNVGLAGDSWTERNTIPKSLIDVLGGNYKDPGFISCSTRTDGVMAGISLAVKNFTKYDGGSNNNNPPPYGCGPDGNGYYNNNTVGSLDWTGITATDLSVFYYDGSGSFTITIDGGVPITINGGNTGVAKKYDISGLSATAHSVTIQSLGVGVVSILCMYGKNSAVRSGLTVSRMGNGGAIASDFFNFSEWITPVAKHLDLDLLFVILGTNDFRLSKGTAQYKNGLVKIITQYRAATPGICICLVSPGHCYGSGTPDLSEYDAVMRELAVEYNVNFISGYQLFPKTYDNSGGAWDDTLHLSRKGAFILTRTMKDKFFQE